MAYFWHRIQSENKINKKQISKKLYFNQNNIFSYFFLFLFILSFDCFLFQKKCQNLTQVNKFVKLEKVLRIHLPTEFSITLELSLQQKRNLQIQNFNIWNRFWIGRTINFSWALIKCFTSWNFDYLLVPSAG